MPLRVISGMAMGLRMTEKKMPLLPTNSSASGTQPTEIKAPAPLGKGARRSPQHQS